MTQKKETLQAITLEDQTVTDYAKLVKELEGLEVRKASLREGLLRHGLKYIFDHNTGKATGFDLAVRLKDQLGASCRVAFTNKYRALSAAKIIPWLQALHVNLDDLIKTNILCTIETEKFVDAEGKFDRKLYDKFKEHVRAFEKENKVSNLLEEENQTALVKGFHEGRWAQFNKEQQLELLTDVAPNTVTVTLD